MDKGLYCASATVPAAEELMMWLSEVGSLQHQVSSAEG